MENVKADNKLLDFQNKVGVILKDSINPFYKSKYADINALLEVIKPILNEVGLVINQPLTHIDGKPALKTIVRDVEEIIYEEVCPLIENTDPQKFGATITYFRRYALQSLLCLQAEDDDGNSTSKQPVNIKPKQTSPNNNSVINNQIKVSKINQLKYKIYKLGAKNDEQACNLIEDKSGIRINSVKDLTEEKAKEILNLFTN